MNRSCPASRRRSGPTPRLSSSGFPVIDRQVRALVKWFMPMKGYGFLAPENGSPDLCFDVSAVEASGRDTLPHRSVVTCETVQGDRGH